jgi:hypothetical protein
MINNIIMEEKLIPEEEEFSKKTNKKIINKNKNNIAQILSNNQDNEYDDSDLNENEQYHQEAIKSKSKKKKKINYEDFKADFSVKLKKEIEYNTLNESVCETLKRDLMRIWNKLVVVVLPISDKEKDHELRHWDLWGPFLFCILLGL